MTSALEPFCAPDLPDIIESNDGVYTNGYKLFWGPREAKKQKQKQKTFTRLAMASFNHECPAMSYQLKDFLKILYTYFYLIILCFQSGCFLNFIIYFVARQTLINPVYFINRGSRKETT